MRPHLLDERHETAVNDPTMRPHTCWTKPTVNLTVNAAGTTGSRSAVSAVVRIGGCGLRINRKRESAGLG